MGGSPPFLKEAAGIHGETFLLVAAVLLKSYARREGAERPGACVCVRAGGASENAEGAGEGRPESPASPWPPNPPFFFLPGFVKGLESEGAEPR